MENDIDALLNDLPEPVKLHIEHLEQVRRDFIANVSHELRTPLTVIHGYLEALLNEDLAEIKPWRKILTQMYQHSIRMERIIDDLLFLSRLESEEQPRDARQNIPVGNLLETIYHDVEVLNKKNQTIILQVDRQVFLTGSEDELKSLFSNLIINAIKYTPAEGRIVIEWFQDKDGTGVFRVTDNGLGIAKEHIPRITERFYRVDKGRSRESGGTGLGLAIVKHVLAHHHGMLLITSELGKGSCFTCVFPRNITALV